MPGHGMCRVDLNPPFFYLPKTTQTTGHLMGLLHAVFVNPRGNVRSGWRIGLFLILMSIFGILLLAPLQYLGLLTDAVRKLVGIVTVLLSSYVLVRVFHHKPLQAIGLALRPGALREFGLGWLLAAVMQVIIFCIMWAAGCISVDVWSFSLQRAVAVLIDGFVFFVLAAAFEEVLFRGYVFQSLMQGISALPAMFVMGISFSLAHWSNPNASVLGLLNVGLAALWLTMAYLKTRSLWLPIGLHFGWNFTQTTLLGLPTSGVTFADKRLFMTTTGGPVWITGGGFGPEGGALATLALLLCSWYVWQSPHVRPMEGVMTLDSTDVPGGDYGVRLGEATRKEQQ